MSSLESVHCIQKKVASCKVRKPTMTNRRERNYDKASDEARKPLIVRMNMRSNRMIKSTLQMMSYVLEATQKIVV